MVEMERMCNMIHGLKPTIMMVTVQVALAGISIFYKLAANDGMSLPVLVAYRFIFAAAVVVPLALYVDRNCRPKLTWMVLLQAFLSALFGGSMAQNLYARSLVLTSATFASAMANLIPANTFIFAIFFRMERLGLHTKAGKAKVVGTLMSIGGAMLLTFYKGIEINLWETKANLLHEHYPHQDGHVAPTHQDVNRTMGSLLALASCLVAAFALIIQAKFSERYPCHYSSTALISVMGSMQAVIYAVCAERDWSQWKLGWNIRLLTVTYGGAVVSGIMAIFTMCCVRMRGPLFVSIFSPLMLVLVALAGSLLLNEKLHLGSIMGAVIIIIGLYFVIWGKGKEMKRIVQLMQSPSDVSKKLSSEKDIESVGIRSLSNSIVENCCSDRLCLAAFAPTLHLDTLQEEEEEEEKKVGRDNCH